SNRVLRVFTSLIARLLFPLLPYSTLFRSFGCRFLRARFGCRFLRARFGCRFLRTRLGWRFAGALRGCRLCRCGRGPKPEGQADRSEEHTSELQSREKLVCRLVVEKKIEER